MNGSITQPLISRRYNLIKEAHDSAIGGHKGNNKTCSRLRRNYYWENIKIDIQDYIDQCLNC